MPGGIAADRLEPILEEQLQEFPFLQSQVRNCSSPLERKLEKARLWRKSSFIENGV